MSRLIKDGIFNLLKANIMIVPSYDQLPDPPFAIGSIILFDGAMYISSGDTWINSSIFDLPPSLQSIANLVTNGNEMLYTIASNTYSKSTITSQGRTFLQQPDVSSQQAILDLIPGTDVQTQNPLLEALSDLNPIASGKILYTTGSNLFSTSDISTLGRNLLSDNTQTSAQTTLGLLIGTDVQPYSSTLENIATGIPSVNPNRIIYTDSLGTWQESPITTQGLSIISGNTPLNQRTTLQLGYLPANQVTSLVGDEVLGSVATQNISNKTITSSDIVNGTISGGTTITGAIISSNTNHVRANLLATSGANVDISTSSPPLVGYVLKATSATTADWQALSATGDVTGPASATLNSIAKFDNISGKSITDTALTIDGAGNLSNANNISAVNFTGTLLTAAQPNITSIGTLSSLTVSGVSTLNGSVNLNNGAVIPTTKVLTITDNPVAATDAANKAYVDLVAATGAYPFQAANYATASATDSNINLASAPATIDGVAPAMGNRILVKNGSSVNTGINSVDNGIYIYNGVGVAMTRSTDFSAGTPPPFRANSSIFVISGNTQTNTGWTLQATVTTIGVDPVTWVQASGSQNLQAGLGLYQSGNTFNVGAGSGITVNPTTIQISATYPGQTSITTLGTITLGTWNGNVIDVARGGTNVSSFTPDGVLISNGLGTAVSTTKLAPTGNFVGTTDTQALTNKTIDSDLNTITNIVNSNIKAGAAIDATKIASGTVSNTTFDYLAGVGSQVVGISDINNLTNKTINAGLNTITGLTNASIAAGASIDATKISSGIISNTEFDYLNGVGSQVVGVNDSNVLTNKTITSTTNTVRATQLGTTGADVVVNTAVPPLANQFLKASTPTSAVWDFVSATSEAETIRVAKSGGDYTTVEAAITAAIALVPSATNPIVIVIYPGVYAENNPLTVPSYVSLVGLSTPPYSIIEGINTAQPIVLLEAGSSVKDLQISGGATGNTNAGLKITFSPADSLLKGIAIVNTVQVVNCNIGFYINGTGVVNSSVCTITRPTFLITLPAFLAEAGIKADMGCLAQISNMAVSGYFSSPANITYGLEVKDTNTVVTCATAFINTVSSGIACLSGGGLAVFSGIISRFTTYGFRLGSGSSYAILNGITFNDDTLTPPYTNQIHVLVESGARSILGNGLIMRVDLTSIAPGVIVEGNALSTTPNSPYNQFLGDISVGFPGNGYQCGFGEGMYHTRNMRIFRANITGVPATDDGTNFVEITSALSIASTTTSLFANTSAGQLLYISSAAGVNSVLFKGIHIIINGNISPVGGYSGTTRYLVTEFWNGSAWTSFNMMSVDSNYPNMPHRDEAFDAGTYDYRFGTTTNWTQKSVNSISGYWMRFRVTTNLTTVPTATLINLHSNATFIGMRGFLRYMGGARPEIVLPLPWNTVQGDGQNTTVGISTNIQLIRSGGRMRHNNTDDYVLFSLQLPYNIDTSYPLNLNILWTMATGTVGVTVKWLATYAWTCDYADNPTYATVRIAGFPALAPNETTTTAATTTVLALNSQHTSRVTIPCNLMVGSRLNGNGDYLWVKFYRDPTETSTTNVDIIDTYLVYTKWCEGRAITN